MQQEKRSMQLKMGLKLLCDLATDRYTEDTYHAMASMCKYVSYGQRYERAVKAMRSMYLSRTTDHVRSALYVWFMQAK